MKPISTTNKIRTPEGILDCDHWTDVNWIPGKLYVKVSLGTVKLFNTERNTMDGVSLETGDIVMFIEVVTQGKIKLLFRDNVYWWRGSCFGVFQGPL